MKEKILELRNQGLSYNQISEKLGCSKSTISYHLNENTKKKTKERSEKRENLKIEKRISSFKSRKLRASTGSFGRGQKRDKKNDINFNYKDVLEKFGENTICYLTGRPINLFNDPFQFDHIIPVSKGGTNTLNNLGITCPEANLAKSDLLKEELLNLCKEILEYNNYIVSKIIN